MKRNLLGVGPVLAGCLLLCGCVTLGRSFDAGSVKTIVVGKTTQADIDRVFGAPLRTGVDSGDLTWTFVDYHFGIIGPQRATDLVVKFGANGIVKSYTFNTNQTDNAAR
jgi:hypothetical protein